MNYRVTSQTISRVVDGEVIALNLGTGQYYTMNDVGTHVWQLLEREASVGDVLEAIESIYDAPAEQIAQDVNAFLEELRASDLIQEV